MQAKKPSKPEIGDMYYNTTTNQMMVYAFAGGHQPKKSMGKKAKPPQGGGGAVNTGHNHTVGQLANIKTTMTSTNAKKWLAVGSHVSSPPSYIKDNAPEIVERKQIILEKFLEFDAELREQMLHSIKVNQFFEEISCLNHDHNDAGYPFDGTCKVNQENYPFAMGIKCLLSLRELEEAHAGKAIESIVLSSDDTESKNTHEDK